MFLELTVGMSAFIFVVHVVHALQFLLDCKEDNFVFLCRRTFAEVAFPPRAVVLWRKANVVALLGCCCKHELTIDKDGWRLQSACSLVALVKQGSLLSDVLLAEVE